MGGGERRGRCDGRGGGLYIYDVCMYGGVG